jgi:predicted ribonuclease YlaK
VYVPDTNALLHNPAVEDWTFAEAPRFTVLLLPAVVGELDVLKMPGRSDAVRTKAESLIRRIKGFRSRGRLTEGVPLRLGVSRLTAWATEPDVAGAFPWLDPSNADDRILAATVEAMRRHPHSPVVLVTRDLNLQNKAELGGVPFTEPPDPPAPAPSGP